MKVCSKCKLEKPETEFNLLGVGTRTRSECRICSNLRYKKWKEDNPEKAKELWRKSSQKYYDKSPEKRNLRQRAKRVGITPEILLSLSEKQGHKCKICSRAERDCSFGRLAIDHCHATGVVRGLLCDRCNRAIGLFYDKIESLESAILYLKSFGSDG